MKGIITVVVAASLLVSFTRAVDPWTPSPLCPFPSTDLVRFPYEGDCSRYWECYNGARYPMSCPTGLEFNDIQSRCDSPELAGCDPDAIISYPTFPHSTVSTASPTPTQNWGPLPECPFPSNELIFFPVATNCAKYWECFQGHRYLMSCPEGLHWNTNYNYCDYPGNVDCTRGSTTTTSTTSTTPGSNNPDPDCPYPSHELTFLPHPSDCSKYYECYEGNKFVMSCPDGLYWNHPILTCDRKENVDCDRVVTSTSSPTSSTSTTTINPTCAHQPDGTYLPHPTDCSKFYECVGGKAIEEQCAGDLFWNQAIHSCDYPTNVPCNNRKAGR